MEDIYIYIHMDYSEAIIIISMEIVLCKVLIRIEAKTRHRESAELIFYCRILYCTVLLPISLNYMLELGLRHHKIRTLSSYCKSYYFGTIQFHAHHLIHQQVHNTGNTKLYCISWLLLFFFWWERGHKIKIAPKYT